MKILTEQELDKRLVEGGDLYNSFNRYNTLKKNYPLEFENFFDELKNLSFEDKYGFLGGFISGRKFHFSMIVKILKDKNLDTKNMDLFEAGALTKFEQYRLFDNSISYFMASKKNSNYFGFEPEKNMNLEKSIDETFSNFSGRITEKINKDEFKDYFNKNIVSEYGLFKERIIESKNPLIFSTYVLGYPKLKSSFNFWNLPGKHIHSFLAGDFVNIPVKRGKEQITEDETEKITEINSKLIHVLKNKYNIKENIELIEGRPFITNYYCLPFIYYNIEK